MSGSYYDPQGFALKIFKDRYALHEEETFHEGCERLATTVAGAETNGNVVKCRAEFSELLKHNYFMPGGRIWYGSGRPKGQLLNCFVIPISDSSEGWGKNVDDMIVISSKGGGVGTNFSPVRPNGADIAGHRGQATGACSPMEGQNAWGNVLKGGGGRRVALMFCLNLNHPDILEFLDKKLDLKRLNNANVSVNFNEDPELFFKKVKAKEDIELRHGGKLYGKIPADKLWERLISNALRGGEPGILNGYLANKMSNIGYYAELLSTNPCITGDTLIAVADGRNAVSIRQLAEEGKDVPVYSVHPGTGETEIKWGINPRKTGEKKEIWKLTLDDGSVVRATPNHRFLLKDLTEKRMDELRSGDSLMPFNTKKDNIYRHVEGTQEEGNSNGKMHSKETKELLSGIRIEQTKKKYEDAGIPQFVKKTCPNEKCAREFAVHWNEREKTYCSKDCFLQVFNRRKDVSESKKRGWQDKRDEKKERWLKLYTSRRFELGRDLGKKEWEDHLKNQGVPSRFGRATFMSLGELQEAANGYNHRVVSAEFAGHEDVYNITVQDNHNYCVITRSDDEQSIVSSGICSANCGEIWLTAYDCCCLGSMVLPRFVKDGKVDWDLLKKSVATSVRFLDNVLTVNNYPLQEIKEMCSNIRRIGLGVLGLHDMLLLLGLKYSSVHGLEMIDKVMNFIKVSAYEASIELAREKGPFPAFEAEKYLKGGFAKTLKPSLRAAIREHGIRNCACLTIPPTGTTALVCDCSAGIEPLFAPAHIRKFREDDLLAQEIIIHPLLKQFVEEGRSTKHFQGAYDLKLRDHFEVQRACQKHIDNAVSKTINVMPGTSAEELSDLYMEYFPELKGVTIYPEGSREDQPLTPLSLDEALMALKGKGEKILMSYSVDACKNGKCDI